MISVQHPAAVDGFLPFRQHDHCQPALSSWISFNHHNINPTGKQGRDLSGVSPGSVTLSGSVTPPTVLGLRTPPLEMQAANIRNSALPSISHSDGNLPGQSDVVPRLPNMGVFMAPNFGPTAQSSFKSVSGRQSPREREHAPGSEQITRRRSLSNGDAIVHYLQIPSSINDSKGSLAEFAAQITCLFWFESSFTLHRVEEGRTTPTPITPLVPDAKPAMGFRKWVTTILSTTQVTQNVILLALMFIYRLKKLNPTVKGKPGSEYRLLTVALMLGNKFLDDNTYTNKTWAEVSGISVQEIHIMEVEFLSNMRYTLYASDIEWREWHVKLGRFWKYFAQASTAPKETSPRLFTSPGRGSIYTPPLPSPPTSLQLSPPYLTNCTLAYPHALPMPPYLAPAIPSPTAPILEVDLRPNGRKRSYEGYSLEPPAKRPSRPQAASSTSSSTLTSSTGFGNTPDIPQLPIPNLSIPTRSNIAKIEEQRIGNFLPSSTGGSIPMAFAANGSWPYGSNSSGDIQRHPDASPAAGPSNIQGRSRFQGSLYGENSSASPVLARYPQPQSQPRHSQSLLSPSVFANQRYSPYKPVRSVNTLLVPPPSASMHNPPQNLVDGRMHYLPLGKPISERKTGVVPFYHHEPLPQLRIPQWHSLPQPHFQV